MNVLIIDAQGGGIGARLVGEVKKRCPEVHLTAVGTNSAATSAMLRAGAHNAATGENAVRVACAKADIIAGPVGIVIADSLLGEITPEMARSVGQSAAKKLLIPINHCDNIIVGVPDAPMGGFIEEAVRKIEEFLALGS